MHLFQSFNFAATNVMFFVVGMILFSSTVLMPQFLQTLMGYTAQMAGLVLSAGALVLLLTMPMVGQLTSRVQARYLLAIGWAGLPVGMYVSSNWVNLYVSFGSATWVRILQFIPLGFVFVPLNVAGYIGLAPEKTNGAAGLMNFTRNIGQSVGTFAVATLIARRSQYHQSVLAKHSASGGFGAAIQSLTAQLAHAGLSLHDAGQQTLGRLYVAVQAQAATLAYVDMFWLLAAFSALMFFCAFLLKANKPGGGSNVSVH